MANLSKVAEDVKGLAKKFQAILDLGAALDEVGSLEQAKRDAEIAKDKAYAEAIAANDAASIAKADLKKVEKEILAAGSKAEEVIDSANKKAIVIVEAAKEKAAGVIALGDKKADDLNYKFSLACVELAKVQADIAAKNSELEDVKAKIDSIKAKLQAFVGN